MPSKKRRDPVALFAAARDLAESALRGSEEAAERVEHLSTGLVALWPAPLTAALLSGPAGEALATRDEAAHARPDWHEAVRPLLASWAKAGDAASAAAPEALGLRDHILHGVAVGRGGRRYGAVALALHKRTADAALAHAQLTHLADHLAFGLFQREAERQAEGRYRDLADLTNLVGHEFNNVLNSVGLQVAALSQKGLTGEHFPELAEVRKEVAGAGRMVRRLQEFSQKGGPPRRPGDLNRAVRAVLAASDALAARVAFEPRADLPPVQGAPLDLERLAAALLRGSGEGALTVRTGPGSDGAVWLRVEAGATDPDDALLPRLFEPFAAVLPGDDGVALALARSVARRVGGSVRGERRAEGGMVFLAELRAAEG